MQSSGSQHDLFGTFVEVLVIKVTWAKESVWSE
jgi:hypothetical protein